MKNKPHIFFYHNGARGDLLISILLGDCLATNQNGAWVNPTGATRRLHKKFHVIQDYHALDYETLLNCVTIRIKFESLRDCEDALKLARIKLTDRNFVCNVEDYNQFEKDFAPFDFIFDKVIAFRDLFDIVVLKSLFLEYHGREMNDTEEQRVVHNIKINLDLLEKYMTLNELSVGDSGQIIIVKPERLTSMGVKTGDTLTLLRYNPGRTLLHCRIQHTEYAVNTAEAKLILLAT